MLKKIQVTHLLIPNVYKKKKILTLKLKKKQEKINDTLQFNILKYMYREETILLYLKQLVIPLPNFFQQ